MPGYRGLSSRLDWLENDIHVLKSHVIGLYQHLGLERVKVIEETCADLRETIRQERLELRKIAPAKKG